MSVANVLDVAKYILGKQTKPITTMKLQKLVYYSQAWHLVWVGKPLFHEQIEAWAKGPVVPELHRAHRGMYTIEADHLGGRDGVLSTAQKGVIDDVLASYGGLTASQLSLLTHDEAPWIQARGPLAPGASSNAIISPQSMKSYYSALADEPDSKEPSDIEFPAWASPAPSTV